MALGRSTVQVASAVVLMPQVPQRPLRHMEQEVVVGAATTHRHMIPPALGALGAQPGQDGKAVSPLTIVPPSMSPLVRVVTEPLPDIAVVTALLDMHG